MTTSLNDLTRRVALLAAPLGFNVTVRLLGGARGRCVELKACRNACGEAQEYARRITLSTVEDRGASTLAADFVREARVALCGTEPWMQHTITRVRVRKAPR